MVVLGGKQRAYRPPVLSGGKEGPQASDGPKSFCLLWKESLS
jgi:hypothetical protein